MTRLPILSHLEDPDISRLKNKRERAEKRGNFGTVKSLERQIYKLRHDALRKSFGSKTRRKKAA